MRYEDASQAGSTAGSDPIARADVETLPQGSNGPGSGNAISGLGTTTGASGADQVADGPATIVELRGAGGSGAALGNSFEAAGQYGTLSMDPSGNFNYVRTTPADGVQDVFEYTLADAKGARSSTTLTVEIPRVIDEQAIVNLPAGVQMSDIKVVGRDLVIQMPDGSQMVIPGGAVFVPELTIGDVVVPPTNLAALLIDSEPEPAAGPPQSSGGNFEEEVPDLDPGVPLGDLIPPTETDYTPPEYEEPMEIEDTEPTIIIITPDNPAGAIAATDSVDESGLPERPGEPEGTLEPQNIETTVGTIVFTADDGLETITINDVAITAVGQQIEGEHGVLTITSINLETGEIGYTYTATDNTTDGVDDFEDFTVVVTDEDGDTATATLHIDIEDDEPIARNDVDTVNLQTNSATGNVMTGIGTNAGAASGDTVGADDATLTAVQGEGGSDSSFDSNGNLVVEGEFGTLTIDAEGNYTYVPFADAPGGTEDVFTYTLTDGDGDVITATLTIVNPDQTPTAGANPLVQLDDDVLGGNPGGPNDDADSLNASGTLSGSGGDGDLTFDLLTTGAPEGFTYVEGPNGSILVQQVQDGVTVTVLTITVDPATGEYTVVQNANILHPDGQTENNVVFTINYTVTDGDGDVATSSLTINVDDDTPLAFDDTETMTENETQETGNVITGSGTNEGTGNADRPGADGFGGIVALVGANSSDSNPSGGFVVEGEFGTLTMDAEGNYTYVRDPNISEGGTDVFTYTYVDGDGDTVTATLTILVPDLNSNPVVGTAEDLTVDEDGLLSIRNADEGQTNPDEDDHGNNATDSGQVVVDFGNDQPANLDGSIAFINPSALNGQLTQGGQPITFSIDPVTGNLIGQVNGAGPAVVTIAFTTISDGPDGQVTYSYQVTLSGPVDQAFPGGDQDENGVTLTGVEFQVTDSDGETATGSFDVTIFDDVPSADSFEITQAPGDEGQNVVVDITVGLEAGADGVDLADVTYNVTSGNADNLSYDPITGEFTYDPDPGETGDVIFTYTVVDGDGDEITQTVTIHLAEDSTPLIETPENLAVDEDGLLSIRNEDEGQTDPDEDDHGANATDSATITVNYGSDVPADAEAAFEFINPGALDGQLTQGGEPITFSIDPVTGNLIGQVNGAGPAVVTIALTGAVDNGDGTVDYTYQVTLAGPVDQFAPDGDQDEDGIILTGVEFQVTDSDNTTASSSFNVTIYDDVPDADDFVVNQNPEDANIVVDITVGLEEGADGVDLNDVTYNVTSGNAANLTFDPNTGEFTYDPDPGETGDVIFTYTVVDGDGDEVTQTVTIHLTDDSTPLIETPEGLAVDEDGLLSIRNADDGDSDSDEDDHGASLTDSETITVDYGNDVPADEEAAFEFINPSALDGQLTQDGEPITFSIDPVTGNLIGQVNGAGPAVVTIALTGAVDNGDGTVDYTYQVTLAGPVDQAAPGGDQDEDGVILTGVEFQVTDSDNTTASSSFNVTIYDDVPTAVDDTDEVDDGETGTSGNVITGAGGDGEAAGADEEGADGAEVTGAVGFNNDTDTDPAGGGFIVEGEYGTLTLQPDGSYTYELNQAGLDALEALGEGDTLTDTFTYTLTDADGDSDTAQLVITLNGANQPPTITGATVRVSEEGIVYDTDPVLIGGNPDTDGFPDDTADQTNSASITGQLVIDDPDGDSLTLTLSDPPSGLTACGETVYWEGEGTDTLSAFAVIDGVITPIMTITIDNDGNYEVTLLHGIDHDSTEGEDALDFDVTVTVDDGTTTDTATLNITVEDDSPVDFTPTGASIDNDAGPESADIPLNFLVASGGDGVGDVVFDPDIDGDTALSSGGQTLQFNGEDIHYVLVDDHTLQGVNESGELAFTIHLDPETDSYTIDLEGPVYNVSQTSFEDVTGIQGGNTEYVALVDSGLTPVAEDILISGNDTVNTNANNIGIGAGQDISAGDVILFEFKLNITEDAVSPTGFVDDGYYQAFEYIQEIDIVNPGPGVDAAAFTITIANALGAAPSNVTVTIYDGDPNAGGQPVPGAVYSDTDGSVVIPDGVVLEGYYVVVTSTDPFTSVQYSDSTANDFKLGEIQVEVANTLEAFDFDVPIIGTDCDGDPIDSEINITLNPIDSNGLNATSLLMAAEESQSADMSASLIPSNDNGDNGRAFVAGNQAALMGVLAAAGLEASGRIADVRAVVDDILGDTTDATGSSPSAAVSGEADQASAEIAVAAAADTGAGEPAELAAQSGGDPADESPAGLDSANDDRAADLSALALGTDAHAAASDHASAMTAAAVAMPGAELVAALEASASHSATAPAGASVAHNAEVGRVLADALAGGNGPDLEALVDALGGGGGAREALQALAGMRSGDGSFDASALVNLGNVHVALSMDALALHHDATPV